MRLKTEAQAQGCVVTEELLWEPQVPTGKQPPTALGDPWPSPPRPPAAPRGAEGGVLLIKSPAQGFLSLQAPTLRPHQALRTCESRGLGLHGNGTQQKTHCPSPQKNHFWVSEVSDPRPTPFLLPWATARGRQEGLLAHRPFGARAFIPKERSLRFILWLKKTQLPQGINSPWLCSSRWPWAPCPQPRC